MLHVLADESDNQVLKMNKSKTQVMMETDTPIYVNNIQIENVESYIYLGQRQKLRQGDSKKKHRDIFKGNIGTCLKRQIYNSCVLLAMSYGAETWALTTHAKNKL